MAKGNDMGDLNITFGHVRKLTGSPREFLSILDHMSYAGGKVDKGPVPLSVAEVPTAQESLVRMGIMECHGEMTEGDFFMPGERGRNTTMYRKMREYGIRREDLATFWMDFELRTVGSLDLFARAFELALLSMAEWVAMNGRLAAFSLHALDGATAPHMHVLWEAKAGDRSTLHRYLIQELS